MSRPTRGVTFDAGALIAADRGDRRFFADWKVLRREGVVPRVAAPVVAQVWRNGARQARLAGVLRGCDVEALDDTRARKVGELCGRAGVADTTDAAVVLGAVEGSEEILTSDPRDLHRLADACLGALTIRVL